MQNIKQYTVTVGDELKKAIEIIDQGSIGIAIVVNSKFQVVGTITDGDVRRALLKGINLSDNLDEVMNKNSIVAGEEYSRKELVALAKKHAINQIPIINDEKELVHIETFHNSLGETSKLNTVILMAGGLGKRLMPLTENTPKPMLVVGDQPILETIIKNCVKYGLKKFIICVNYLSDQVKDHFGDGSNWGIDIEYVDEEKKLGTAGALSLITKEFNEDVIVMNADLLTNVNFDQLLSYHKSEKSYATMCVKEYDFKVPYGVVKANDNVISSIEEKPVHRFFINAGIYVLSASVLTRIESNQYLDMPQLFNKLLEEEKKLVTFPIREYWLDVGLPEDFQKAKDLTKEWFNG